MENVRKEKGSDLNSTATHVRQDLVDPLLVDCAKPFGAHLETHPTPLTRHPKPAILYIRQKTSLGFVLGVRHIVPSKRTLSCDLTNL